MVTHTNSNSIFNMKQLGRKIATYRKSKNLTQSNLADEIGVTHQAISSWETGLTAPDISKLTDLSHIFDVSIDDLLDNERLSSIISKIEHESDLDEDEVVEVAGLMKPDQLNETLTQSNSQNFSIKSIIRILPFMDEATLDAWIDANSDNVSLKDLTAMLPFVSEGQIDKLLVHPQIKSNKDIMPLLPFLTSKQIDRLIEPIINKGDFDINEIVGYAPFMTKDQLNHFIQDAKLEDLTGLAPFLDRNELGTKFINAFKENKHSDLRSMIPFIPKSVRNQCVDDFINDERQDISAIEPLLPFLGSEVLMKIFTYASKQDLSVQSIKTFL